MFNVYILVLFLKNLSLFTLDWYSWQHPGGDGGPNEEAHEEHHQRLHRQSRSGRHLNVSG